MKNIDPENELEDIQADMEIARIQREDNVYLNNHPDPYKNVDWRVANIRCPLCKAVIPYRGCAYHFEAHINDSFGISQNQAYRLENDAPQFIVTEAEGGKQ